MKQIAGTITTVLLIVVLASLAACGGGTFTDPSHTSGSGGDSGGKPARLSSNASYDEAMAKLDEIIAYCQAHPGLENDSIKMNARQTRDMLSWYGDINEEEIDLINFYVEALR
ncbi:MAG: hypothetical protein LBU16_08385 [Treponema sp.]|jgi:ABC-type glycerol-3-phosphate transport system substrate-binding protein|nr:hypothetical protein [Treponema sp.]